MEFGVSGVPFLRCSARVSSRRKILSRAAEVIEADRAGDELDAGELVDRSAIRLGHDVVAVHA